MESVPKITGLRGPPAFRLSPTFSRPHGYRVLDTGGSIGGEHPGSGAGPGVVQQHVFKNITTHSLTNEVKSYNPDYWCNKIVNYAFRNTYFPLNYKTTHHRVV